MPLTKVPPEMSQGCPAFRARSTTNQTDYVDVIMNYDGGESQYINSGATFTGALVRPA